MTMTPHRPFPLFSRILHWTMAAMVLAMLFIGIGMVSSVSAYHRLRSINPWACWCWFWSRSAW